MAATFSNLANKTRRMGKCPCQPAAHALEKGVGAVGMTEAATFDRSWAMEDAGRARPLPYSAESYYVYLNRGRQNGNSG